ncbi:MAG TPA: hypothetical protein ACFYEL_10165 [Candidatus Wunengus californicus]|uniref:hypothetical protein n=1 Tax=Candidatus Wunengus californicus TaxID=3367619 RepID=UPI004029EAE6
MTDNLTDLRKRLETRFEQFTRLEASYKSLMAMTDTELMIYNANARHVLASDPVYRESQDYDVLEKLDKRTMTGAEYAMQLFPGLARYENKPGRTLTEKEMLGQIEPLLREGVSYNGVWKQTGIRPKKVRELAFAHLPDIAKSRSEISERGIALGLSVLKEKGEFSLTDLKTVEPDGKKRRMLYATFAQWAPKHPKFDGYQITREDRTDRGTVYVARPIETADDHNPNHLMVNGNHNSTPHNGNGRNGNHYFRGPPPGFGIALGGDVVPVAQLVEANRGFIQNTRMR